MNGYDTDPRYKAMLGESPFDDITDDPRYKAMANPSPDEADKTAAMLGQPAGVAAEPTEPRVSGSLMETLGAVPAHFRQGGKRAEFDLALSNLASDPTREVDPEEIQRILAYEDKLSAESAALPQAAGPLSQGILGVAGTLPAMWQFGGKPQIVGAAIGGGAGLAGSLLLGGPTGEEAAATAGGARIGMAAGANIGRRVASVYSFNQWRKQGTGMMFADFLRENMPQGQAKVAANIAGTLYAAVEFAQFELLFGGGGLAFKAALREASKKGVMEITRLLGKDYLTKVAGESGEEAIQEGIRVAAMEFLKHANKRAEGGVPESAKKVFDSAVEEGIRSIPTMAILGLAGVGGEAAKVPAMQRQAKARQARAQALAQPETAAEVPAEQPQAPIEQTEQRGAAAPLPTAPPVASPQAAVPPAPIEQQPEAQPPAAAKIQQEPAPEALAPPQARPGPEAVGTTQQGGRVPPAAIEQLTLPGRAGISEEQKPPELMTPEERARDNVARLPAERQELALNNLHAERTSTKHGFYAFQRELDRLDREAATMTPNEWKGALFFEPPVQMQRWGYPEERPLTEQEARILNSVRDSLRNREYAPGTGDRFSIDRDWPVVRGGDFATQMQYENLTGQFAEGRKGNANLSLWGKHRGEQHAGFVRDAVNNNRPVSAAAVDAYGIKLPEGYVREGDRYIFKGVESEVPSAIPIGSSEVAPALETPAPVQEVGAEVRKEGGRETEEGAVRQQPSLPSAAPMSRQQVVMDAKRRAVQAGGAFVQRQVYGDEVGVISIGPATIRVVHAPPPSAKLGTAAGEIAREGRYQYTMYVDPETGQSTTVSHELGHVTRDILHVNERAMIKMVYGWDLDTRQGDETFAAKFETEEGRKELAAGLRRATVGQQNVVLRAINRVIGFMNAVFKTKIARIGTAGDLDRLAGTLEGFGALRELAGGKAVLMSESKMEEEARFQAAESKPPSAPKGDSPIERMNLSVMSLGERLWRNIADIGVRTNLYAKHLVGGKEWQETYRMVQGMIGEKGKNALSTARGIADSVVRAGLTEKELNDYLDATHSKDRNEMFRKRGEAATASMTDDEADKTLKALAAKEAKLRPIAEMVWKLNAATRRAMVDYGLVEQSVVDNWVAEFGEHYVPLRSEDVEGDMARYDPTMRAGIQGLEAMEAHGRGSRAFSPLAWSVAQAMHTISRGEHNIVAQELAKLVQANPMAKVWSVEAIPGMAEIKEAAEIRKEAKQELAKARDDMLKAKGAMDEAMSMAGRGMVVASTLKQAKANLAAARERHEALKEQLKAIEDSSPESVRASQPAPGYAVALTYKDGGQQMRINMNDPWLYRALTFSSPPIANKALHGVVTATKMYGRLLTEYNPEWWLVNLVKDLQTAGFNLTAGKGKGLAVKTYRHFNGARRAILAGELGKTVKNAEWAKYLALYNKGGGPISVIGALRAGDIEEEILRLTKGGGIGKGNMGRILAKTGQWMDAQQRSIELGTRLAVFRSMMESGFSEKESILGSKNATVNFEMKGELSNRIGGLYLFFNASLQGPIAMGKALVGPNGIKMMAGTILLGYVMDQINRAVSPDDDDDGENDYDRIPDWQKDNNIFIGNKVRIPLGYGLSFFYALGRNLSSADSGTASMEKATANMLNSFLTSFNPLGGKGTLLQNIAPTMAAPAVQVYENKDFMGRPIYPTPYGIKKPSDVSWRDTPESAKALSKIVSRITGGDTVQRGLVEIPPNIWDHILRFFTPGPASTAKRAFDTARKLQSGKTMEAKDIPGVRRFAYAASDKQAFQRFYEINNIARDAERKYKAYLAAGERENAKKWREGHIAELRIKAQADAAREKINKARGNASKAKGYLRDTWEDKAVKEARRVIKSYATMKEKEKAGR